MAVVAEKMNWRIDSLMKDLRLLVSLYVAHFIVWRELRRLQRGEVR